jgi:calcineurin-like phosphoesterase family protein
MSIFFISDVHFGHNKIIEYCKRPWATVEEMDQALVDNWNAEVKHGDTVYHLGDWAFHNYERVGQLKGNIISVPGNHDHERMKKLLPFLPNGFTDEIHYLKIDNVYRFVLCHYPLDSWRREYKFHLHGHMHGVGGIKENRLDVGVDAHRMYKPIHLDDLVQNLLTNNQWAKALQQ